MLWGVLAHTGQNLSLGTYTIHFHTHKLTCFWSMGGNRGIWWKSKHKHGEHKTLGVRISYLNSSYLACCFARPVFTFTFVSATILVPFSCMCNSCSLYLQNCLAINTSPDSIHHHNRAAKLPFNQELRGEPPLCFSLRALILLAASSKALSSSFSSP